MSTSLKNECQLAIAVIDLLITATHLTPTLPSHRCLPTPKTEAQAVHTSGVFKTTPLSISSTQHTILRTKEHPTTTHNTRRNIYMGLCGSSPRTNKDIIHRHESNKQFAQISKGGKRTTIGKDEFASYIEQHAELWAMLGVNLGLDDASCKQLAVDVAFNMVVHKNIQEHKAVPKRRKTILGLTIMTEDQFHMFLNIVNTPQGQLEFFHRTVFQAFDKDNNGVLDSNELDEFLETFYKADSIFKGDARLPPKEELKRIVKEFDVNNDNLLSFVSAPLLSFSLLCSSCLLECILLYCCCFFYLG